MQSEIFRDFPKFDILYKASFETDILVYKVKCDHTVIFRYNIKSHSHFYILKYQIKLLTWIVFQDFPHCDGQLFEQFLVLSMTVQQTVYCDQPK